MSRTWLHSALVSSTLSLRRAGPTPHRERFFSKHLVFPLLTIISQVFHTYITLKFLIRPQYRPHVTVSWYLKECHPRCACRNYVCWR